MDGCGTEGWKREENFAIINVFIFDNCNKKKKNQPRSGIFLGG